MEMFQTSFHQVGKFSKVSYSEFAKAMTGLEGYTPPDLSDCYDNIILPRRQTSGSAGYDFYAPFPFKLYPGDTLRIPTGIKCEITPGWWLSMVPRSSLGFRYNLQFDNTISVIDSDYYGCEENEGHIYCQITNRSRHNSEENVLNINAGDRFCQAIFLAYGVCFDDDPVNETRVGKTGSTGK